MICASFLCRCLSLQFGGELGSKLLMSPEQIQPRAVFTDVVETRTRQVEARRGTLDMVERKNIYSIDSPLSASLYPRAHRQKSKFSWNSQPIEAHLPFLPRLSTSLVVEAAQVYESTCQSFPAMIRTSCTLGEFSTISPGRSVSDMRFIASIRSRVRCNIAS